jgi:hypothetical protein
MAASFVMVLPAAKAEKQPAIIITAAITATNFFIFFSSSFCPVGVSFFVLHHPVLVFALIDTQRSRMAAVFYFFGIRKIERVIPQGSFMIPKRRRIRKNSIDSRFNLLIMQLKRLRMENRLIHSRLKRSEGWKTIGREKGFFCRIGQE